MEGKNSLVYKGNKNKINTWEGARIFPFKQKGSVTYRRNMQSCSPISMHCLVLACV